MLSFDPLKLSEETEKKVIQGRSRKYNGFRIEHFYGQIFTARGVGCNLRCCFCWINPSRDFPQNYGRFYSPEEVYTKLEEVSSNELGTEYLRISGCEPTIGKEHLLSLLELCAKNGVYKFLLETNGILLDENYVKALSEFKKTLFIRLSFKAGTPEDFQNKTGANVNFFHLPFNALKLIRKYHINYGIAAMSKDPVIMPPLEKQDLLIELIETGEDISKLFNGLEEEKPNLFGITQKRLLTTFSDCGHFIYEPLLYSLLRSIALKEGFEGLDDENLLRQKGGILSLVNSLKKYTKSEICTLIENTNFRQEKSSCETCSAKNPWHGHGVYDDLDETLGEFIH